MRQYELMVIFPLEEEPQRVGREQLQATLAEHGAKIEKTTEVGDRDLAYEIDKHRRGKYILYNLSIEPAKITALAKIFKLNSHLLRYLFVNIE